MHRRLLVAEAHPDGQDDGAALHLPTDELVAACLRQMSQTQEDGHAFLVAAGKELAILLSGEFNRLKAILGRIR